MFKKQIIILIILLFLISLVKAETITLNKIVINTTEEWCFNQTQQIKILAYNKNNSLISLDKLTITLIPNINYTSGNIYEAKGEYLNYLIIPYSNLTFITLNITAQQRGKTISQELKVNLKKCGTKKNFLKKISNFADFLVNNYLWFIMGGFLFLAIILVIIIIKLSLT